MAASATKGWRCKKKKEAEQKVTTLAYFQYSILNGKKRTRGRETGPGLLRILNKKFGFFARAVFKRKYFFRQRQRDFVEPSRAHGTYGHTAHAGNTTRFVGLARRLFGDGVNRARGGASAAVHARTGSGGFKRNVGIRRIRAAAFDGRRGKASRIRCIFQLAPHILRK